MNRRILVLGLHRVGFPPPDARIRGLFTTPKLLSFELWLLQKLGYKFSTLKDAMLDPSGKTAVVTFDDGYADTYVSGLPILEAYKAPATIFVITDDVGKKEVSWDEAGEKLPADIVDWEMLADLQKRGWEVASHGHRHVHFDRQGPGDQETLISRSVFAIEENLGTAPISFAYPYGKFNESTKATLRRFGIRFAVTTGAPTHGDLAEAGDLLEIRRLCIGGRRFYHYLRVLLRTLAVVGPGEALRTAAFRFGAMFVPEIAARLDR